MTFVEGAAVVAHKAGGPDVLSLRKQRFHPPAPNHVRIAVERAGVAYGDLLAREGMTPGLRFPLTPGYDAVGRIDAVGPGVSHLSIGQRVATRTNGTDGYATHVFATPDLTVPVADDLDSSAVSALILNYVTAWQMLTRVAPTGESGTVLVHGAAGGVGGALAELARVRGLSVIGTASPSRLDTLRRRGIAAVARGDRWVEEADALAPGGVDAVFDGAGGRQGRESLKLLGPGGRLVIYGASGALRGGRRSLVGAATTALASARPSALALFRRGIGVIGYMSATFVPAHPAWFREDLSHLMQLVGEQRIAPTIAGTFPLEDARTAHEMLAEGASGKIVLSV
jgi:NADPH:quinone reductase-like Zn-dependent oxidoreductase